MHVPAGARLNPHVHPHSGHHVWVLDGVAEMLGRTVGKGADLHVPAGREHGLTTPGPSGCTVFYLYLREPHREDQPCSTSPSETTRRTRPERP